MLVSFDKTPTSDRWTDTRQQHIGLPRKHSIVQ